MVINRMCSLDPDRYFVVQSFYSVSLRSSCEIPERRSTIVRVGAIVQVGLGDDEKSSLQVCIFFSSASFRLRSMSKSPRASLNSPSPVPTPKSPSPGPSAGKPRPNANANASPTPRRTSATPAAPPVPRGPTPSALETSYHKRLRSILLEHKKLRKEWNELVLRGVLGRCKGVIDCWVEVE